MRHILLAVAILCQGCTLALPDPVTEGEIERRFKNIGPTEEIKRDIYGDAERCGGTLTGHRKRAAMYNGVRVTVTSVGALTAGVSGVTSGVLDEKAGKNAAAYIAAVGGGIALVGTFLSGLVADPGESLKLHASASKSYSLARSLAWKYRAGGMTDEEQKFTLDNLSAALDRCGRSEEYSMPPAPGKAAPPSPELVGPEVAPP